MERAFICQLVKLEVHIMTMQALGLGKSLVDLKHCMDKTFHSRMPKLSVTMVTQEEAMEVGSGLVSYFKCVTFNKSIIENVENFMGKYWGNPPPPSLKT